MNSGSAFHQGDMADLPFFRFFSGWSAANAQKAVGLLNTDWSVCSALCHRMMLVKLNDNWNFKLRCFACSHFHQHTYLGLGVDSMGQIKSWNISSVVRENLAMHIFRSFGTAGCRHTNSNLTLTICLLVSNLSYCFTYLLLFEAGNIWVATAHLYTHNLHTQKNQQLDISAEGEPFPLPVYTT